ncbi:MAG TPA: DUF6382 domain-containing protein [Cerasibacillus sp.]|uniref:DUF6382 domain-containing protein n=1 Tax=Cerasibacillus sp. TaxID=2498711 RepID=UPI002F3E6D58
MKNIYNLAYEVKIQEDGSSISITKVNEQFIQAKDMEVIQVKNIQSNKIPRILPIKVDFNQNITVHYRIDSLRPLDKFFQNINATAIDYAQLFLSITKALEESKIYTLNQNNFILHPNFIYVGQHAGDVYLTYVPIKSLQKNVSTMEELKQLLVQIAGQMKGLQGEEHNRLMTFINSEMFNLQGLKEVLLELTYLNPNNNQISKENVRKQIKNKESSKNGEPIKKLKNKLKTNIEQQKNNNNQKVESKNQLPPLTTKSKIYMFGTALIAIIIIWLFYSMQPKQDMLLVSGVATLLIMAMVFIFLKVWRPGVKRIETEPIEEELNQQNQQAPQAKQQSAQGIPNESRKQLEWNTMAQGNQQNHHVTAQPIQHEPLPPQQHHDFQQHDHQVVPDTIPSQHQERQQPVHPIGQESIQQNQLQNVSESLSQNPSETINQHATPIQTQREIVQPLPSQVTNVAQKEAVKQATSQAQMSPAIAATSMDTALLDDESDDTVLLDESVYAEEEIRPILIRETEDGTVSEIIVDSDQFMIGRNSDLANYLEDTIGVSRKHAEIVKIDEDTYGIKDLDSKNGTRVNGKALVPLKVYELNEDDQFRIGKVDYTFKWETKE